MVGKAKEVEGIREEAKRTLKYEAAPSDNNLITSSIRKKKRGTAPDLQQPAGKRLNLGQNLQDAASTRPATATNATAKKEHPAAAVQRLEQIDSPELRKRPVEDEGALQPSDAEGASAAGGIMREGGTISPPTIPEDIAQEPREPTPEPRGVLHNLFSPGMFSPVFQLFQPGQEPEAEQRGRSRGNSAPRRVHIQRSKSRSPEEWEKMDAEEPAGLVQRQDPAAPDAKQGATGAAGSSTSSRSAGEGQKVGRPAVSDAGNSTDGESETCLTARAPSVVCSRESDKESEMGEEVSVADLAQDEPREEEVDEYMEFDPYAFIKSLPPLEQCAPTWRRALLPKQTRNCKRKTLVLDLDETLVHSTLDQSNSHDFAFEVSLNNTTHSVNVKQRPHMATFLTRCAQLFEVVIFTASQKLYAEQLLNVIDPGRKLIRHRIFRDSCLFVDGNYMKDLTVLGRDMALTLIVDNSPQAFGFQVENGVPIESWYDDESDEELLKMLPFLESLVDVPDVRPLILSQFKLQEKVNEAPTYIY